MDFTKLRHILFFALLLLATFGFLYIIAPFAYPIFWAAIIAGIFYPIYKRIRDGVKNDNASAAITLIIAIILIIIPIGLFATLIIGESAQIFSDIGDNRAQISKTVSQTFEWIKNNSLVSKFNFDEKFWSEKLVEGTQLIVSFAFDSAKKITQNSLAFALEFVLMLYALFFFLRDGERWLKYLMHLSPLGDRYEKKLYQKFASTTGATLKGSILIGGLQGLLGAIIFYAVGVQGAFIWGLIMAICALLPTVGTGLVWLPIGIVMIILGNVWQGILILLTGFLIISTIDNLIKPILIGRHTQLHPLIVLFSSLGAIAIFGISGFVIGPIISSLFITFWQMYDEYFQDQLNKNNANGF